MCCFLRGLLTAMFRFLGSHSYIMGCTGKYVVGPSCSMLSCTPFEAYKRLINYFLKICVTPPPPVCQFMYAPLQSNCEMYRVLSNIRGCTVFLYSLGDVPALHQVFHSQTVRCTVNMSYIRGLYRQTVRYTGSYIRDCTVKL